MKVHETELSVFAQNLRRLRKRRGLSQYDLAELTGISRRMIGYYETKDAHPPLENLEAIARVLKVKVSDLIDPEKEKEADDDIDVTQFDSRSLRKLKEILSLPQNDRNDLYRMLNRMLRETRMRQEQKNNRAGTIAEKPSASYSTDVQEG